MNKLEIGVYLDLEETIFCTKPLEDAFWLLGGQTQQIPHVSYFKILCERYRIGDWESIGMIDDLISKENCAVVKSNTKNLIYVSKMRTDFDFLIGYLKNLAVKVFAMTGGRYVFQKRLLEAHNIIDNFDAIIAYEQINSKAQDVPYPKFKIIIDNGFFHEDANRKKCGELGCVEGFKKDVFTYYSEAQLRDAIFVKADRYQYYDKATCIDIVKDVKRCIGKYLLEQDT